MFDEVPERDVAHYHRGLASQELFFYANRWQRRLIVTVVVMRHLAILISGIRSLEIRTLIGDIHAIYLFEATQQLVLII